MVNTEISQGTILAFLNCRYRAHPLLAGSEGVKTEFEVMMAERRNEAKRKAVERFSGPPASLEILHDLPLVRATIREGATYVFDAVFKDDFSEVSFDGLKRMPGASLLGDFHYIPIAFSGSRRIQRPLRLLLEVLALLRTRVQGPVGLVHARGCSRPQEFPSVSHTRSSRLNQNEFGL
jgi:hypothetical protein